MLPLVREPGCGVKGLSAAAVASVSEATSREIDAPSAGAQELSLGPFPPNSLASQSWRPQAPPRMQAESFNVWTRGRVETLNSRGFDYRSCCGAGPALCPPCWHSRAEPDLEGPPGSATWLCSTFLPLGTPSLSPLRKLVAGPDLGFTTPHHSSEDKQGIPVNISWPPHLGACP